MSRAPTRSEPYGGRFTKEAPRDGEAERLRKGQVRRAMIAGTVGTSIEWYDFFLYGTAAALVFPDLFFPGASAYAGALASFATLLPEPNRAKVAREFEQGAVAPVPKPVMTSAPPRRAAALAGDRQ
jgi:hypothetical protein